MSNTLKIAAQKQGRLAEKTLELLKSAGLDIDLSKDQLFARCGNFDLELLFLRDDDIPEYVQDGVCDLGIVGENTILEKEANVEVLQRLGFAQCRLCLAIPDATGFISVRDLTGKRIATSYPVLTRRFLVQNGVPADIVEVSGSVEVTPKLDMADAIVDLVSSGNTLRRNGLREVETLLTSEAVLVKRQNGFSGEKLDLIDRLVMRIQGALKAKRTKYVMMNAPATALAAIQEIIPGLESPTVVPLAKKGMIAIQSVVDEEVFWDVMERLKEAGASGILVVPIEKMIL